MSTSTRPQGGGILPAQTLKSLDDFMDRLNQGSTLTSSISNTTPASNTTEDSSTNGTNSTSTTSTHSGMVYILLVGTNEGIPLSRSYGSTSTTTPHHQHSEFHLSDELISSVETIWATLPSSMQPSNRVTMMNASHPFKDVSSSLSAAHPLLKHIGLGSEIQSTIAYFDSCILVHVHYAPLVVTFIASHDANIGKIQQNMGLLKQILEPVTKALVDIMIQTEKY
jgi:hypothetical protein